jgi:Tol biopolymer transport system component
VDRTGKAVPLAAAPDNYQSLRLSPDGKSVALAIDKNFNMDIWTLDLARKALTRLTFDDVEDSVPCWTPDGKRIAFSSDPGRGGYGSVYVKPADGTGKGELLTSVPDRSIHPASWSTDGKILVTIEFSLDSANWDIGVVSMDGERKWKPLLKEKHNEAQPRISPDGKWIAYMSDESGGNEVYVRPFPGVESGGRWQVSTGGGDSPLWSANGLELFYRNGEAVMTVPVKTGPVFSLESPRLLFRGPYVLSGINTDSWDISPDSKRFLMIKEAGGEQAVSARPRKINVVLNWFEELKQRVPKK